MSKTGITICVVVLCAFLMFLFGISSVRFTPPPPKTIENIVRIFMHEPNHYSLLVQDPETGIITPLNLKGYDLELQVEFIPDVPSDKKDWLVITYKGSSGKVATSYEFHIHGVGDINGAGWNRGKFGQGQTSVVQ